MSSCLKQEEAIKFINVLKTLPLSASGFKYNFTRFDFTNDVLDSQRAFIVEDVGELKSRAVGVIAEQYGKELQKKYLSNPDLKIFTNVELIYSKAEKHAMALYTYTEGNNYIMELFDPNSVNRTSPIFVNYMKFIVNYINEFRPLPRKLLFKSVNVNNVNTLGGGNCNSWTSYYLFIRPYLGSFENARNVMKRWRPEYYKIINRDVYKINRLVKKNRNQPGFLFKNFFNFK